MTKLTDLACIHLNTLDKGALRQIKVFAASCATHTDQMTEDECKAFKDLDDALSRILSLQETAAEQRREDGLLY